jgi:hypothetical protein
MCKKMRIDGAKPMKENFQSKLTVYVILSTYFHAILKARIILNHDAE